MKINMIGFTKQGCALGQDIKGKLEIAGHQTCFYYGTGADKTDIKTFAEHGFATADALIYIGATGIAVRSIARYVTSKLTDPAVIVVDDCGKFVIPMLSGHVGGGNDLANMLAEMIKATPVITTATDNNKVFAIDSWAKKAGMTILYPQYIKEVSGKLLSGETVGICSKFPIVGGLPEHIGVTNHGYGVLITSEYDPQEVLQLVPKTHVIGIGCRKDTPPDRLLSFVKKTLAREKISPHSIAKICSIDVKKDEPAILSLAKEQGVPFMTFTATELNEVAGEFTTSQFVKETVGTDNVCERSAVAGSNGTLILKKTAQDGMTIAIARQEYTVVF